MAAESVTREAKRRMPISPGLRIGRILGIPIYINAGLDLFNLLPGFPLDGGRIFRAIVWGVTKDFARATRVDGMSGKVVAYGMIVFGAWYAMKGQWTSGLWLAFIGWFLLNAAQESVAQVAISETLSGLHASDGVAHEVPTVGRNTSLEEHGQDD